VTGARSILFAVLAAALIAPVQASAATTIGSSLPTATGEALECAAPAGCTLVETSIAGTQVVVPYDGVIIRWAARVPAGTTSSIGLRVVRPVGGGQFASVAQHTASPDASGVISGTPIGSRRVRVKAGDLIGVDLNSGEEIGVVSHATPDSASMSFVPLFATGETRAPTSTDSDDFEALFNATIEPDADGDGYGDETQDSCPQLAQERRPCTSSPALGVSVGGLGIGVVDVGKQTEIRAGVSAPAHVVPGAVLRLTLPAALELGTIRGTAVCTAAGNQVTCPLGDMPARQRHSVVVDVLARRPTAARIRADLTTGLPGTRTLVATAAIRVKTDKRCGLTIPAYGREHGTSGGDRITGAAYDDYLTGRAGDDCLIGRAGDDILGGGDGDDDIDGGPGSDLVRGDAGDDRLAGGRGDDRFEAGPGNDRIDAVDGQRDVVRCGPGRDRARVDRVDSVAGCERLTRRR
jgi:hypothetical protein